MLASDKPNRVCAMYPDLWLTIQLSTAQVSVSLGPKASNVMNLHGELAEGFRLASDQGKDLSRLPWTISVHRGGNVSVSETAIGVAYPVLDPDRAGGDDFFGVETTVESAQFDRMVQLLKATGGDTRIGLCIGGLDYGKGPLDVTRIWTLPDTLPVIEANLSADLFTQNT